jgi:hypothetical protein
MFEVTAYGITASLETSRITNHSSQSVLGLALCWSDRSLRDNMESRFFNLLLDTINFRPVLPAGPSATNLVMPPGLTSWQIEHRDHHFEIDSVLFADFSVHGPNTSQLDARLVGAAKGEHATLTAFLADNQSSNSFEPWLNDWLERSKLIFQSRTEPSAQLRFQAQQQFSTAHHLLGMLRPDRETSVLAYATSRLANANFALFLDH